MAGGGYIPVIAENPDISDYFYGSGYERILEQIVINYTDDGEVDINSVMDGLSEEDALLVKDIVQNVLPVSEENETLIQCAKKIKSQSLRRRHNEILKILEILDEDQDREQIEKLSEEIMNINSIMKEMNERKE